ncbi:unannotated protein [freshwater metagenome]|uniref:Unannotated protein n=1 Tax=freshwater metagenome TaxID=449393 RepID=A0A6J7HB98_9ZZZZ|nr:hypothetical protein [Actinomycetota bacterium]
MAPSLSPNQLLIDRPRLTSLPTGIRCFFFSAPSGFGKSVAAAQLSARLAAQLAAQASQPSDTLIYCRLTDEDAADNGAGKILGALTKTFPHLGQQQPVIDSSSSARLMYCVQELAGQAILMIDDLHLLNDPEQQVLQGLLDAAPDGLCIIGTSRDEPGKDITARNLAGDVSICAAEELLMTESECAELAAMHTSTLTGSEIFQESAGWPLAAAFLAQDGSFAESDLVAESLNELSADAQADLQTLALLSSISPTLLDEAPTGRELVRFTRRHPELIDTDPERWRVREFLRSELLVQASDRESIAQWADRFDRLGATDSSLILLSRVPGNRELLQDRLEIVGSRLLDQGRYRFLRMLVSQIPVRDRRTAISILDLSSGFWLDQIEQVSVGMPHVEESSLTVLANTVGITTDDSLALAGLQTEFYRRRGDPSLLHVALNALSLVGPVDHSADPIGLCGGLSQPAQRGLGQVLFGLAVAELFSGEPETVRDGRRLQELSFKIAERAGADTAALRAQSAYERVGMGLDQASTAVAPLEAGIVSLAAMGHPDVATLQIELADILGRLQNPETAEGLVEGATEWAEKTGNTAVLPSIALVRATTALIKSGPSQDNDQDLESAWKLMATAPRLRRALPGFAARISNRMMDFRDCDRASAWLDRAGALASGHLQSSYSSDYLAASKFRLRSMIAAVTLPPDAAQLTWFQCQPAGLLEFDASVAWDLLPHDGGESAKRLLETSRDQLDPLWLPRLEGNKQPAVDSANLSVSLLCPVLKLQRGAESLPAPTGHAARLLALLVVSNGSLTIDAVLDDLWPEVETEVARNRLHQVILRLRRALSGSGSSLVSATEGVLLLDKDRLESDLWALRQGTDAPTDEAILMITRYESDLCAAQFAYDAAFEDARWELRSQLTRIAKRHLDHEGTQNPRLLQACTDAWARLDFADEIGYAVADVLDRSGDSRDADVIREQIALRLAR